MAKWDKWIHEGPAAGLRRQHRFSRTVNGWMPTAANSGKLEAFNGEDEVDEVDGLSIEDLTRLKFEQGATRRPAGAQQEVDDQAAKWKGIWTDTGKAEDGEEVQWPADLGAALVKPSREDILDACTTFPDDTGLGWDRFHPKAIRRVSDDLVDLLILVLTRCEGIGDWPRAVAMVLIALLPKDDGDFRAIGLMPVLPRLWMRLRRNEATKWDKENSRWYLYAGKR